MILNLLTSAADKTREVGIDESALYALLGFLVVFVGIAFLIFVVWLVGLLMAKTNVKTKEKKAEDVAETINQTSKTASSSSDESVTDETVAVITAAIMAYYQKNNPKCEFTVKRIKRI